jgi:DNA-binding MarR family transcriptional regulator
MPDNNSYPNLENCNPRECIARKILKSSRIITSIFRKHLLPFQITYSQTSILFIVAKKGVVTQSFLAEALYLEKSTVSRNMRRLFQQEYLLKETTKNIIITEKGKTLLEDIVPAWNEAMAEARNILKDEGETALNTILQQLTA